MTRLANLIPSFLRGGKGGTPAPSKRSRYFGGAAAASFLGGMQRPMLREQADDVREAWQTAAGHAIHKIQNSGFISGVVDASTSAVVGNGLNLAARPDFAALGWDEAEGEAWAEKVERMFYAWGSQPRECDASGRMNFGQMQIAAYKSYLYYGEVLGHLPLFRRVGRDALTKVLLLPPSRLSSTATDVAMRTIHGVKMDEYGAPISYFIRTKTRLGMAQDQEYRAYDADGRQNIIHLFDPGVATTRGITPLAPVLKVASQFDQLADATIAATLLQTMFAATIKNNTPGLAAFSGLMTEDEMGVEGPTTLDIDQFVDTRSDFYDSAKVNLHQHGRIAHLFPNDELEFHEAKHPSENYDNFASWLLREIARCVGVTYEEATGDYRSATYSSVRISIATIWPIVLQRRQNIVAAFCQSVYEAWLEEMIGEGKLDFPGGLDGFIAMKPYACSAWWNGPAAPQADDLKAARADETLLKIGGTTLEAVSAKYGRDWRDDMKQRKREKDLALSLGLPDPHQRPEIKIAELKAEAAENAALEQDEEPPAAA